MLSGHGLALLLARETLRVRVQHAGRKPYKRSTGELRHGQSTSHRRRVSFESARSWFQCWADSRSIERHLGRITHFETGNHLNALHHWGFPASRAPPVLGDRPSPASTSHAREIITRRWVRSVSYSLGLTGPLCADSSSTYFISRPGSRYSMLRSRSCASRFASPRSCDPKVAVNSSTAV